MPVDERALFLSLRPRFAELLLAGEKTVELRRIQPAVSPGTLVLLYASSPVQALVGTGMVREVRVGSASVIWKQHGSLTGLSRAEYDSYFAGAAAAVAITLRGLNRLARPIPLGELRGGLSWSHPPQSFRYLDAEQVGALGLPVPEEIAQPAEPPIPGLGPLRNRKLDEAAIVSR